ncbi:MAG: AI-2E family transporter [Eubacterium sp.]|nr:AI-2E family transporter [Eubacterium sp.]
MKRWNSKFDKYWYAGVTAFLVVTAALVVKALLDNLGVLGGVISAVNGALTPVYIGLIIAFLLSPLVNAMDEFVFVPLVQKIVKKEKKAAGIARGLSVTVVLVLALVVIFGLIMMVVPEVINSISSLAANLPEYYRNVVKWGDNVFRSNPKLAEYFENFSGTMYEKLITWLQNDLLPESSKLLSMLTDGVVNAMSLLIDLFIGIIVSIYLMAGKENFCAQAKKLIFAVLPQKRGDGMLEVLRETHTVFAKFISGKIVDSLVVGMLTFIIMSIANIPYALLISVIIGVTNVIPFFGQYIGIIPSAVLVFIANPSKGVIFLILIIILMQFDGNVLGPKILGDSIGLKSFWILFSILFFGSLFGFLGMICAVPIFAMIYRWVKRWSNKRLAKKEVPVETEYYRKEPERKKKNIEKEKN